MIIWILTILATIILHGSSIPQFIRNYKRKTTNDISLNLWIMILIGYLLLFIVSYLEKNNYFLLVYGIGIFNIGTLLSQIIYYKIK